MKNKKANIIITIAITACALATLLLHDTSAQMTKQVPVSAYIVAADGASISNGEYEVRFALYRTDRTESDPYPSDTDAGNRLWSEVQKITVRNGVMHAALGSVTPLPETLSFNEPQYFLGIRVGSDSEMVPRKKIAAVPQAVNSLYLRGATVGTNEGDILQLGKGGKINIKQLPTGSGNNSLVLGDDSRLHDQNSDTGTSNLTYTLGTGKSSSGSMFTLNVSQKSASPSIRYNGPLGTWQYSNDGSNFADFGSGAGAYLPLAGGTMAGDIIFSGSQTFGGATLSEIGYLSGATSSIQAQLSSKSDVGHAHSAADITSGTLSVARGGTGQTTLADLITLGTDTTGNYVASISNGNGISGGGASEGAALTLSLNLLSASDGAGGTSSFSGMEFSGSSSNQLSLLQGCSDGQILKWDETSGVWTCSNDLGASTAVINIKEGSTTYSGVDTLTFSANDFSISKVGSEASVAIDYANSKITRSDQNESITGSWTFSGLTLNGNLAVRESTGATYYTTFTGGDQSADITYTLPTSQAGGSNYVLSNNGSGVLSWQAVSGVGGVSGSGTTNYVTYWTGTSTVGAITTGNNQFLTTNGSGVPSFTNISADTFTQYALLAGRNGGQTLIGGTASGDDLTFQTTSNATKGSYIFSELGSGIVLSTAGTLSTITNNSSNWDAGYTYRFTGVTNSATGLTLSLASNNLTASLTSGYVIPTTTEQTNWNTAYTNRITSASYPLSISSNQISLGYNSTNLQLTANQLNTIQNINSTATPTFGGLTLNGNLVLGTNSLTTTNTTLVSNLNADLLDGQHASAFLTGNQTITLSGDVSGSGTTSITTTVADDSHNHTSTTLPAATSYLGSSIESSEITDSTVAEVDLSATNSATAGYILSYDSGGGFTWIANTGGSGSSKWTDGGTYTYLTSTSNDLVVGASSTTAPLFFDTSASRLNLGLNGTSGSLALYSEVGATDYTVILQPSSSMTQNTTYTLPVNDGDSSQVLVTNGSGVLSWETVTGIGGAGDITGIGDVTSGEAFTSSSTQGTSLYFYDADGRGQLTIANLSAARTYTLPDASGTIWTSGNDGSTSTLDADLLDGHDTSYFQVAGSYQTQNANLTSLAGLSYTSAAFVKMTGANTFTLDTNTYITGNQTITLSGDVSGSGTTSITTTVADDSHNHTSTTLPATTSYLGSTIEGSEITNDTVVLTTDTAGNYVASITNGNGIGGGNGGSEGATLTLALAALTSNWSQTGAFDIQLANASSELQIMESTGATYYGTLDVGDLSADATYTLSGASGTIWTSGNDGSTSTLDADLLDGHDTSYFQVAGSYQTQNANLTSLAGLSYTSAAFVKMTGANTFTLDTNTYLTSYTETDPRLPAAGTSGNLLQSNGSAWTSWTPNYLTANQTITLSGDVSGSGTTSITTTVADDSHNHTSTTLPATTSYLGSTIEGSEITNDTVVLTTDTAGNYVASITNGNGIGGGNGGSEGATLTLALAALTSNWSQTGAFDIQLANASSELQIMESTGATYYGTLDVGDLSADATYTLSGASGTIWTSGNDGSTSTLDADLLDGHDTSYFQVAGSYQTQNANLTSLAGLSYTSAAFVKMTGANTFTLDTNTYLTSYTETDPRLPAAGTSGNLLQSNGSAWTSWTPNYLTSYTETDPVWTAAAGNYFNLADNETVTGIPAFNGGITGTSAPFSVDSTYLVTNLNADLLDGHDTSYFQTALTNPVTGTGTNNYITYWTGTSTVGAITTGNNQFLTTNGSGVPSFTNISTDTFTQYALLAGRNGGQTLIGGSGTTDDLILRTTSGIGASGADMIFQTGNNGATEAMRILYDGSIGMGISNPTSRFMVKGTGNSTASLVNFSNSDSTSLFSLLENGLLTLAGVPTGSGIGQGSVYINPATANSSFSLSWSAKTAWNFPDIGSRAKPEFADLDGDGDYDALIGDDGGVCYAYKNTGSASSPTWTAESSWNTVDAGGSAAPALADLDGDGDYDLIISANGSNNYAYENTGSTSSPTWTRRAGWDPPNLSNMYKIAFGDLDNDGDYDLLMSSNSSQTLYAYENTGSSSSPTWTAKSAWNLSISGNMLPHPALVDLDGDGDLDIMVGNGSTGYVNGYENTGSLSSPSWSYKSAWNSPSLSTSSVSPTLADLDNDGDKDMLVGVLNGDSKAYENTGTGAGVVTTLLGVAVGGSEKFSVKSNGNLNAAGSLTLGSNLDVNYNGILAAIDVTQSGTGAIANFKDGANSVFYIKNGGNVGIGTTNPGQKLTVDGTFGILEGGSTPTYHTIFQGGDQSADITYTLPTASTTGLLKNTAGVWSWDTTTYLSGIVGAANGGTGLDTSSSTGVATVSSGTWSIASSLGVTLGGTGTTTQFTQGSIVFAGASGVYSQDNANFFWDDSNNRLGIGTTSPSAKLDITGEVTTASIGSEMISSSTDRDFTGSLGNWVAGSNWAYGTNNASHTAGSTGTLSLSNSYLSAAPVSGNVYQITFTINTTTAGTLTPSFGSSNGITVGQRTGTITAQVQIITATGTGMLTFTPDSAWAGTIDDVSIKMITAASATQIVRNSDNSTGLEIRSGGSGLNNTFIGLSSGLADSTGNNNSSFGYKSLYSNTEGYNNTASGYQSLFSNTNGYSNSAFGINTLFSNTSGYYNNALGHNALYSNITGYYNNAFGYNALNANNMGSSNNAFGHSALFRNTTGTSNNAFGYGALGFNVTGGNNTAMGDNAGLGVSGNSYSNNSFFGYMSGYSITTGSNNILLGYRVGDALTSGSSNILLGYDIDAPSATGSSQLSIGNLIFATGGFGTGTTVGTGNVGIGTNSPSYKLHVDGDIYTSGDLRVAGDDLYMNTNTSGYLLIADGTNYNPVSMSGDLTITSAGVTTIEDNSIDGTDIALGSDAQGDIMYYNGTDWVRLAAGTSGYYLQTQGAGANPRWYQATGGTSDWTKTGGTPDLTYLTDTASDFVIGGSTLAASMFGIDESNGDFYLGYDNSANPTLLFEATDSDAGSFGFNTNDSFYFSGANVGIGTTSPTSLFSVGASSEFQVNSSGQVVSGAWNGTAISAQYGGTGLNTSASTGVPTISSGTWSVSSSLGISMGGTNATTIGSAGSVAYSSGSAYAFSAVGTAGQALISGGSGAPTWFAPTAGSLLFAGTNGVLAQDNANLFWNDTDNYLYLGSQFSMGIDTTDSNKFKIYPGNGIAGTNVFSIDTSGVTTIASLNMGSQNFAADSGAISWIDMPVTSSATNGTVESYTAQLDGNAMLTIYGTSDGAGGTSNRSVRLGAPLGFLESTGATYYTYFQGGDQSADITYTLPTSSSNGFLSNSSGTLSWTSASADTFTQYALLAGRSGGQTLIGGTGTTDDLVLRTTSGVGASGADMIFQTGNNGATEAMRILYDGKIGIGDTSPDSLLDLLSSSAANTVLKIANTNAGDYDPSIGFELAEGTHVFTMGVDDSDSDKFKISTTALGTNDRFVIDSSGNVGIGDASPASLFTVGSGDLFQISSSGQVTAGTWQGSAVGVAYGGTGTSTQFTQGSLVFAGSSGVYGEDNSNLFWDDSNNYLGIGTSSPAAKLNLFGTGTLMRLSYDASNYATLASSSTGALLINSSTTTQSGITIGTALAEDTFIKYDGNAQDYYIGLDDTDDILKLGLGGTIGTSSFLTINSSGKVGIGTSGQTALLHLSGAAGTVGFELNSNESTSSNNILMLRSDVASGDDAVFRVQANGATYADGSYTGTGADYAEYFVATDKDLAPGEAVCVDTTRSNSVKRCVRAQDPDIMGIVSTSPSVIGNYQDGREADEDYAIIGMLGQVDANVSDENGSINPGDLLTSATKAGYLMKANAGDSTVGVAMETLQEGEGSVKVLISRKNKSITVEKVEEAVTQRIAEMNVQDQVNQMIQMAQAQLTEAITSQSTIVTDLSSQLNVQINRIATLESQIELITSQNNAILDFAVALNAEKLIFKDELGNVDLLGGKLEAAEVVAGAFTVKAADPNAKTIGQSYIAAVTVDDNGDGIDDVTGTDGMSYEIKTTAARSNVRIYVTPVGSTENQVLYIADIKEGESFTVKVDQKVTHDVKFNWWIVQTE